MTFIHELIGEKQHVLFWQMCIRAALVFVFALFLIRVFGRRAFGKSSPLDIVVSIVVGSNLSRALTGNSEFFATLGASAFYVILYWLLARLAVRSPLVGYLVKGEAVHLTRNGVIDDEAMLRASVSRHDLEEAARRHGISNLRDVSEAVIERGGDLTAIRRWS